MKYYRFLTALLLLLLPGISVGQSISSISGTMEDDAEIVLLGSGFGTKTNGPPLRWLDFDNGQLNATINEPGWTASFNPNSYSIPHYSDENMRDGTFNGKLTGERGPYYEMQILYSGRLASVDKKIYASFYHWVDKGNQPGTEAYQQKSWRIIDAPGDMIQTYPAISQENLFYPTGSKNTFVQLKQGDCPSPVLGEKTLYHADYLDQGWTYLQLVIDLGDKDASNGMIKYTINCNEQGDTISNLPIWCGSDTKPNNFMLANYYGLGIGDSQYRNKSYWDDVYIDDTWQRVEIGDNANYNACTHREVQIPVTWSSESIVLTVNRGAFLPGESAYLFVIDENNEPSPGYAIEWGGVVAPIGPGQPSKPIW